MGQTAAAALPAISQHCGSVDPHLFLHAVAAGARISGDRAAVPYLVAFLLSEDAGLREAATRRIGELGALAAEYIGPIEERLADGDPGVRASAALASQRLKA